MPPVAASGCGHLSVKVKSLKGRIAGGNSLSAGQLPRELVRIETGAQYPCSGLGQRSQAHCRDRAVVRQPQVHATAAGPVYANRVADSLTSPALWRRGGRRKLRCPASRVLEASNASQSVPDKQKSLRSRFETIPRHASAASTVLTVYVHTSLRSAASRGDGSSRRKSRRGLATGEPKAGFDPTGDGRQPLQVQVLKRDGSPCPLQAGFGITEQATPRRRKSLEKHAGRHIRVLCATTCAWGHYGRAGSETRQKHSTGPRKHCKTSGVGVRWTCDKIGRVPSRPKGSQSELADRKPPRRLSSSASARLALLP